MVLGAQHLFFSTTIKCLQDGFMVRMSSSACAGAKLRLLICFEIIFVFGVGGLRVVAIRRF